MAYTTTTQIRRITNITIQDIDNTELNDLIGDATVQLNSDINTPVTREFVVQIDNTRKNSIDGSNTTFYVQNWKGKYISDSNDDGTVDASDVTVYLVAADGTETTATVSSVTSNEGKIVLSSAPTNQVSMYISYNWAFEDPSVPSPKIALACALLTAAYAYEKINRGMSPQQVYGNVRFMRDMRAGNEYFGRYENEVGKINSAMGDYAESPVF